MNARSTFVRRTAAGGMFAAAAIVVPIWAATPAAAASLCAPPSDTVPPQVQSVQFGVSTVDLSTGPYTVPVTVDATDTSQNGAASGVAGVGLLLSGPGGGVGTSLKLTGGTADDGVWTGTLTIPKRARPGTWTLRYVQADDAAGNQGFYPDFGTYPQGPTDIRLQSGWDTTVTLTGHGAPPPKKVKAGALTSFGFNPSAVNTTKAARKLHVTASFSSPAPRNVSVIFSRSKGHGRGLNKGLELTKHATNTWTGTMTVPEWLGDATSRPRLFVEYPAKDKPQFRLITASTLHARHFSSYLKVTSNTDRTKPVLTSLTFSPPTVNSTSGTASMTVTATATDTLSGVHRVDVDFSTHHGIGGAASGLYPFPGIGYETYGYVHAKLQLEDGQWVGTARFRKCVPSGSWQVSAYVEDGAHNAAYNSSKKLIRDELPGTLSVTSKHGDVVPPYVRGAVASGQAHTITLDFSEGVKNVNPSTLSVYAMKPKAKRFQSSASVSSITCSNGSATIDCAGSGGLVTSAVLDVPAVAAGDRFEVFANQDITAPQLTDGAGNPLDWGGYAADVTGS
ncbi:MAG TPA: hypothetical protein VME70_03150 [Mycobacteriales bacterium]|nr:hypothetical protein [Mycobacteriales bacterium]